MIRGEAGRGGPTDERRAAMVLRRHGATTRNGHDVLSTRELAPTVTRTSVSTPRALRPFRRGGSDGLAPRGATTDGSAWWESEQAHNFAVQRPGARDARSGR